MARKLDMDSPAEVVSAAGKFTTNYTSAVDHVDQTCANLYPASSGNSPLDLCGTGAARLVRKPLRAAVSDGARKALPIATGTPPAATLYELTDTSGAVNVQRHKPN